LTKRKISYPLIHQQYKVFLYKTEMSMAALPLPHRCRDGGGGAAAADF
jgi:hypothetical protein